jgi:hypothetical protein
MQPRAQALVDPGVNSPGRTAGASRVALATSKWCLDVQCGRSVRDPNTPKTPTKKNQTTQQTYKPGTSHNTPQMTQQGLRVRSGRGPTFRTARRGTISTWMRQRDWPHLSDPEIGEGPVASSIRCNCGRVAFCNGGQP